MHGTSQVLPLDVFFANFAVLGVFARNMILTANQNVFHAKTPSSQRITEAMKLY